MGQQLTMTPQLQQAIKLLQLSTLDLQQEIQNALDSNIMLEVDEEVSKPNSDPSNETKAETEEINSAGSQTEIPTELPIDSSWEDVYEGSLNYTQALHKTEFPDFESQHSKIVSLKDYLLNQLKLSLLSERDQAIAITIIDSLNEDGYLSTSLEDVYTALLDDMEDLEFDEVQAVLHSIQNFDPIGIAALDLADCLSLQLKALPTSNNTDIALTLIKKYLDLLATQQQSKLMQKLGVSEIKLEQVISLIRSLDPKPGQKLQQLKTEYVVPDVFVTKKNDIWQVNLNADIAPKLRINPFYSSFIKRADNSQDNLSMKTHLQEAKWFIKSLYGRNETLLRVAKSIIAKQVNFLQYGDVAMKPMVLRDIAEELELHESTISRVTTKKYMHTPNGIFEFKYFFSSHVSTTEGGDCSAIAIRAFIKELIANELPNKPLSDDKISKLLQEKGINIARRTIAKYRETMSIASSRQRKRLL